MAFTHRMFDVGDVKLEYLDTGAPSDTYYTYVLFPGACHTARNHLYERNLNLDSYSKMLEQVPHNSRAIAMSPRGTGKSDDLPAGKLTARQLLDLHVTDAQTFIEKLREFLNADGQIIIVAWSMAGSTVLGLFTPEHFPRTQKLLPSIKRISFWDPPQTAVHGKQNSATDTVHRPNGFLSHITLFIDNLGNISFSSCPAKEYSQLLEQRSTTLSMRNGPSWQSM
jgi:hypothetical protein